MYDTTSNKVFVAKYSCEDHISNLPESVISHILSRLPTKEAVQTCVLSTDWKYKWTSIYNVDMVDYELDNMTMDSDDVFCDFMERMMRLSLSHNVRSFSLRCYGYYGLFRMSGWISSVFGPNLETFKLIYGWDWKDLVSPMGLLDCISLKTLQLVVQMTLKVPAVHTFPNLVRLHLSYVDVLNEDLGTSTMILKFPVLKVFRMNRCKWSNVKIVEIHAPALTVLSSRTDFKVTEKSKYSIKVIGAKISKFITRQGLPENFIFTGSKVDYAAFSDSGIEPDSELFTEFALKVRMLLKELWSIKYLMVSSCTADAIELPNPGLCLPRFVTLERINIEYHVGRHGSLLELLHFSPFLKTLNVEVCSYGFLHRDWRHHDDVVGSVPSCIISSLEKFEIRFSLVSKSELYLVKFFMENGKKLKRIHLKFVGDGPNANDFQNQISKFAKAAENLQVVVSFKEYP